MDQIAIAAVNAAVAEKPGITDNIESLILESHKKFIQMKLDDFPRMCEIARVQNYLKLEEMRNYGHKGKYTDSYGWSESGEFKWEFDIPNDLYLFMRCLVYKDFWTTGNKRISKAFMNAICRGDDPMTTLMKVKTHYGPNSDIGLIK